MENGYSSLEKGSSHVVAVGSGLRALEHLQAGRHGACRYAESG